MTLNPFRGKVTPLSTLPLRPMKSIQRLLTLSLVLLLTACGFHLRGMGGPNAGLPSLNVVGGVAIAQQMARALEVAQFEISTDAPYQLVLQSVEQRQASQNIATPGFYEQQVAVDVTYQMATADGVLLLSPVTLSRERFVTLNQDDRNGASNQLSSAYRDLTREAINAIVMQMQSMPVSRLQEDEARIAEQAALQAQMKKNQQSSTIQVAP